ncbi:hypothetical protein AAG570_007218 [Ranatra chinensis]|uniref:Uncharacterized protein n=1 Tax=Ranatra chinensis TaxID=642074 RepID=A0ABD0XV84_9HEMI
MASTRPRSTAATCGDLYDGVPTDNVHANATCRLSLEDVSNMGSETLDPPFVTTRSTPEDSALQSLQACKFGPRSCTPVYIALYRGGKVVATKMDDRETTVTIGRLEPAYTTPAEISAHPPLVQDPMRGVDSDLKSIPGVSLDGKGRIASRRFASCIESVF